MSQEFDDLTITLRRLASGDVVRERREALWLSRDELARRVGIDNSDVEDIENGERDTVWRRDPNQSAFDPLAAALEMTTSELWSAIKERARQYEQRVRRGG